MHAVTLPGIGGSDERHWQTLWEQGSPELKRFAPQSWDDPELEDWFEAVDRAIGEEPAVLIAHSLSCLLAVRWSHANPDRVAGLFLVAVPDPTGPVFPSDAASFTSGLGARISTPAVMVSSDDDPYCSAERSAHFANMWGIPLVSVGARGHLNSSSGLGPWVEGRNLLTAFTAGLGNRSSAALGPSSGD